MNEILIFGGTTEGRKLSECLRNTGVFHTLCVATEYGEAVLKDYPKGICEGCLKIHCGRMDREEISEYISSGNFAAVVDATHPYAGEVTENIKSAMKEMAIPYFRLKRETSDIEERNFKINYFDSTEACKEVLKKTYGNILLTTGSKELSAYCVSGELKSRLYIRVLPGVESLKLCMEQGIGGKQILALQGPFSVEMNEAILRQYQIKHLVTKASGRIGGYKEKIEAAKRVGIPVYVIGSPCEDEGYSFSEVCQKLSDICGKNIKQQDKMEIILAGVGMGSIGSLTIEVYQEIENADILLGAERIIAQYQPRIEKKPFYSADKIIPYLKEIRKSLLMERVKVVILFSGDSGFYSGCQTLYKALQTEMSKGDLQTSIHIMPGVSSIAYMAACIRESYHDASIYSIHGKEIPNLVSKIKRAEKVFILMSGPKDVNMLGKLLMEEGLNECEILVGYQLSYPEQQFMKLIPKECCGIKEEGLYICYIKNPHIECGCLTHGKPDTEFIRDKVPMTKEEVREVSICKLRLHKNAIVYDIGSGTGSIAVEIAGLSDDIHVFAIEKKEETVCLIEKNIEKRRISNISIIAAEAPEGLNGLPVPTHAFIGGSGGRLKEIMTVLYQINPQMRVVINAISMETICEIKEILSLYPMINEEIVQMQVSRAKAAGQYHLMQAENPVWVCSFNFTNKKDEIR